MRSFAFLLLIFCLCQAAFAQSGSLPLKLLHSQTFAQVQLQAGLDADGGPVYSNSPLPNMLPFHATLTGSVTADSTLTKLAIFSDDGCDVYVNGTRVWHALDAGQALPNLSQSLHELPVTMTPGQTYSIRIEYSNIYYGQPDPTTGKLLDIDGCTLFMYGAASVSVANVQYKDPASGNFVTISGTIYVLKNTTLTFKAIPNPSTATFPANKPVWSGTSGAYGTGTMTDVQFTAASASATDYKTVIATSDNAAADQGVPVNVIVTDLALKQVSFSGTSYHTVKNDLDGSNYSAPQWQDNSVPLNGSADDAGDKDYPLCYTQSTSASVSVLLVAVPTLPTGATMITSGQVQIKGNSTNSGTITKFSMAASGATVDSTGVSVGTTAAGIPVSPAFPATVNFYSSTFGFEWYYSPDNGTTWATAGLTNHKVYVTLGDPITTNLYQTVLDVGCRNAAGKSKSSEVVDAIWSDFHNSLATGVKNARGQGMKYWANGYDTPALYYTRDLVANNNGRCGAWSEFMRDVLRAQSIGADIYGIDLKPEIKPVSVAPPGYPYYLTTNPNGDAGDGFYTDPSHPSQGNTGPALTYDQPNGAGLPIQWFDHAVVELTPSTVGATLVSSIDSTSVYDPSYGYIAQMPLVGDSQQQWETHSITQYWSLYTDGHGNLKFVSASPAYIQSHHGINAPYVTFSYDKHPQQ